MHSASGYIPRLCSCGIKREGSLIYAGTCYDRGASIILKEPDRAIKTRSGDVSAHRSAIRNGTPPNENTKIELPSNFLTNALVSLPRKWARTSAAPQKPPNLLFSENRQKLRRETSSPRTRSSSRSHQVLCSVVPEMILFGSNHILHTQIYFQQSSNWKINLSISEAKYPINDDCLDVMKYI